MAYTKKTVAEPKATVKDAKNTTEKVEVKATKEVKETKVVKQYSGEELIPCQSVTKGELIYYSPKSEETYIWTEYGDIKEVQYQDLNGLRAKRSGFIFEPLFIILDDDLLADPKWKQVADFYDTLLNTDDINEILSLSNDDFRTTFKNLPKGLQKAVVVETTNQIESGVFDSLNKIKIMDEIYGSDLAFLLK